MTDLSLLGIFRCGMPDCHAATVYVLEGGAGPLPMCADHAALVAVSFAGLVPLAAFLPERARIVP